MPTVRARALTSFALAGFAVSIVATPALAFATAEQYCNGPEFGYLVTVDNVEAEEDGVFAVAKDDELIDVVDVEAGDAVTVDVAMRQAEAATIIVQAQDGSEVRLEVEDTCPHVLGEVVERPPPGDGPGIAPAPEQTAEPVAAPTLPATGTPLLALLLGAAAPIVAGTGLLRRR